MEQYKLKLIINTDQKCSKDYAHFIEHNSITLQICISCKSDKYLDKIWCIKLTQIFETYTDAS